MKQPILSALLSFFVFVSALNAQSPLYIMFDPSCTNQLEYQYTYTGQNLLMYSIAKGDNELYFFLVGAPTDPTPTANPPKGTVACQNVPINTGVMDAINAGGKVASFVFRQQNGYITMPVQSGGYVLRSGTSFAFRSPNYDFAMDTLNIDYARNLSQPGVASPVYLTGRRDMDCLDLYAFRLEPISPESPRADVEVIPGIGIISDRTGRNGVEMEQNVYRLMKINGMSLDDYIYAYCRNLEKPNADATGSFITNIPQNPGGTNDPFQPYDFSEPNKEDYLTQQPPSGNQQLSKCPEKPGYGYHLVQPGETMISIARMYNLNPRSLQEWNNISNADKIAVCDKLWLSKQGAGAPPPSASNLHVVQRGETLSSIARKYNVTVANLRSWNNMRDDQIQAGQRLKISDRPDGTGNYGSGSGGGTGSGQGISGGNSAPAGRMVYKTQRGETLNSVAWKFGYTTPYLRHINQTNKGLNQNVSDDAVLPDGIVLIVSDGKGGRDDFATFQAPARGNYTAPQNPTGQPQPPTSGFEYVGEYFVKEGDTLASIARQYNLSPDKLAAANGLRPGQEPAVRSILKIPK
jgi:LysM repeat protein